MNISGKQQYSKATRGLRQPNAIFNQQFKLIFIYPMICDSSVQKYETLIRDFISTSMGKEIFVSNSLNIFSMASSISPLIDENGDVVDLQQDIPEAGASDNNNNNLFFSLDNRGSQRYNAQQQAKSDVAHHVEAKTAKIKQLLNIDPMYKSFRPFLELITLENFIDVPVIIGTKSYQVNTFVILLILTVSIASKGKYKLNSQSSIKQIFYILKNINDNDFHTLLNRLLLVEPSWRDKLVSFFEHKLFKLPTNISSFISTKNKQNTFGKEEITAPINVDQNASTLILSDVKRSLGLVENSFNIVTNSKRLYEETGLAKQQGQLSHTLKTLDPEIEQVFDNGKSLFVKLWGNYSSPIFKNLILFLMPTNDIIPVSKILLAIEQGDTDVEIGMAGVFPAISSVIDDLKTEINNHVSKDVINASKISKKLNIFCNKRLNERTNKLNDEYGSVIATCVSSGSFDQDQFINFETTFNKVIHKITSDVQDIKYMMGNILPTESVNKIFAKVTGIFQDVVNELYMYLSINNHQLL